MIRKVNRRGKRTLVVDIVWRKADGSQGRYRKDATVQTMAAATAEERRLLANLATYGDVFEPSAPKELLREEQPKRASRSARLSRASGRGGRSRS
jgi:hypothetical protein